MGYRFTRGWGQASVVVGAGLIGLALLVGSWLGFSSDEEFRPFSPAVRILGGLLVSLVGLILGGTMIVAGQLVSVLLDQRDLLDRIYRVLAARSTTGDEAITRP